MLVTQEIKPRDVCEVSSSGACLGRGYLGWGCPTWVCQASAVTRDPQVPSTFQAERVHPRERCFLRQV